MHNDLHVTTIHIMCAYKDYTLRMLKKKILRDGCMLKRRVQARMLERILFVLMLVIGIAIAYIFFAVQKLSDPQPLALVVVLLLLVIASILGLTVVLLKVYEQGMTQGAAK
jgi:hypothetical protein